MKTQVVCTFPNNKIQTHIFDNIKEARTFAKKLTDIYEGKIKVDFQKAVKRPIAQKKAD